MPSSTVRLNSTSSPMAMVPTAPPRVMPGWSPWPASCPPTIRPVTTNPNPTQIAEMPIVFRRAERGTGSSMYSSCSYPSSSSVRCVSLAGLIAPPSRCDRWTSVLQRLDRALPAHTLMSLRRFLRVPRRHAGQAHVVVGREQGDAVSQLLRLRIRLGRVTRPLRGSDVVDDRSDAVQLGDQRTVDRPVHPRR